MLSYSTPFSGYSFSYDARNRQTQAFVGAIGTGFLINGLGQRIAQINGSVPQFFFVYDEARHLAGKYDGLGNPLWQTVWLGDLPVAVLLQPSARSYSARALEKSVESTRCIIRRQSNVPRVLKRKASPTGGFGGNMMQT